MTNYTPGPWDLVSIWPSTVKNGVITIHHDEPICKRVIKHSWRAEDGLRHTIYVGEAFQLPEGAPGDWAANAYLLAAGPDMYEALQAANRFITNGIELGYIRLPDTPDLAHQTPALVHAALAKARGEKP